MNPSQNISKESDQKEGRPGRVFLRLDPVIRLGGRLSYGGRARKQTTEERKRAFWSYVKKGIHEDDCWEWIGTKNLDGYGRFNWNDRLCQVHRLSYMFHFGNDPYPKLVLHSCDNPACVNPAHLFLGTDEDNDLDKRNKGRSNHASGDRHWNAQLSEESVRRIRRDLKTFVKSKAIQYNASLPSIWLIVRSKLWRNIQ